MDIKNSIVAILNSREKIVGTGFLASQNLVVTCAHVIVAAGAIDGDTVQVRFYGRTEELNALVAPEYWRDVDKGDVAVLRLENVPDGVSPLPLGNTAGSAGHDFYAYGYAIVTDVQGIGARGKIVDIVDNGRLVQLTSQEPDHGMSGGPVWDEQRRVVIGMVTKGKGLLEKDQNLRNTQTTFATTVDVIREVCPELRLTEICPYRSLDVFNEEDAPFFFGREKVVQKLLDSLKREPRFLAVLGPSGSGKSSVVRAGLIPALRQGKVPGSQKWDVVTIRPTSNPFDRLVEKGFLNPQDNLVTTVEFWLADHPGKNKLALVIDQFEEILVATPEDVRHKFIAELSQLLDSPIDVAVVLTLRDDFYSTFLQECVKIARWLERGLVNIPVTLDEEDLRAIIFEPAKNGGLILEDGLEDMILKDTVVTVKTEKVIRNTVLPLLEFSLTQLWENRVDGKLTREAYEALGGVTGGLAQWANKAHYSLDEADRKRSRNIFCSLVHLGNPERGIPDSRRQCALGDLTSNPAEQGEVRRVVNALADARLIVTGQNDRKQESVDLIHDSLIAEWMRLQRWVDEDRKFLIWKQRIEERIQDWKSEHGDLLRGNALVSAKEFLETHGERLDEAVVTYINKSITEEEQIQQKMLSAAQPTIGEITDLEVSILEPESGQFVMEMSYSAPGVEITETTSTSFDILELDNAKFDMDEYSRLLSKMFFADDKTRTMFIRAYDNAVSLGLDLRLRFRVQNGSLYNEHWETLRHPLTGALLGNDERILISRYQTSGNWNPVKLNARSNLKALLMVANPLDLDKFKLAPLDARLEIELARKGLGNIPSTILEKATLNNLRDALRKNTPDIVYIVSHGFVHGERGPTLFWEDDDGNVKVVRGDEIADCFSALKSPPALVVLGSAQSSSNYQGNISALGVLLIQAGIPAVLSVMGKISLQTWHTFVPVFFASLQSDGSVDRAITVARNSVQDRLDAWAPILLMRLKNGKIFV